MDDLLESHEYDTTYTIPVFSKHAEPLKLTCFKKLTLDLSQTEKSTQIGLIDQNGEECDEEEESYDEDRINLNDMIDDPFSS